MVPQGKEKKGDKGKSKGGTEPEEVLDDDGADEDVSDDEDARKRKKHLCGPNCNCEFLTRPKLRDEATNKDTHLLMCYQGIVSDL